MHLASTTKSVATIVRQVPIFIIIITIITSITIHKNKNNEKTLCFSLTADCLCVRLPVLHKNRIVIFILLDPFYLSSDSLIFSSFFFAGFVDFSKNKFSLIPSAQLKQFGVRSFGDLARVLSWGFDFRDNPVTFHIHS